MLSVAPACSQSRGSTVPTCRSLQSMHVRRAGGGITHGQVGSASRNESIQRREVEPRERERASGRAAGGASRRSPASGVQVPKTSSVTSSQSVAGMAAPPAVQAQPGQRVGGVVARRSLVTAARPAGCRPRRSRRPSAARSVSRTRASSGTTGASSSAPALGEPPATGAPRLRAALVLDERRHPRVLDHRRLAACSTRVRCRRRGPSAASAARRRPRACRRRGRARTTLRRALRLDAEARSRTARRRSPPRRRGRRPPASCGGPRGQRRPRRDPGRRA